MCLVIIVVYIIVVSHHIRQSECHKHTRPTVLITAKIKNFPHLWKFFIANICHTGVNISSSVGLLGGFGEGLPEVVVRHGGCDINIDAAHGMHKLHAVAL